MNSILIIEDEPDIARDLIAQFKAQGYIANHCYDGTLASKILKRETFDCILLDINIPGKNGIELCKELRRNGISTPVLMLTAYSDLDDKLEGFGVGADDYLTKPFYFKELLVRVQALIKRGQSANLKMSITIGGLSIDTDRKIVLRDEKEIVLTPREYEILLMLAGASGAVISKREIISRLWGASVDIDTNTVEVFINSLRNKIDKEYVSKLIHTKIGFGYYLSAER